MNKKAGTGKAQGGKGNDVNNVTACPLPCADLEDWVQEARGVFGVAFNGLEVLHANDSSQHGWDNLYKPLEKSKLKRHFKMIQTIRHNQSRQTRLDSFDRGLIYEDEIYSWFYDLVWRQNNEAVVIKLDDGEVSIENKSGRWNKKRPWGYQVRKRLKGVLSVVQNPIMLTLTVSKEKVTAVMPYNTNHTEVSYAICHVGEWIRTFNQKLWKFQAKQGLGWLFKGWVLEFQGEKGLDNEYNRGFPHIHEILGGNWVGDIREIERLWPYGSVEITTKKDVERKTGKKYDGLRLANYLTKYVSKGSNAITEKGVHKGFAWLAYSGGRVFSVKHEKKDLTEERLKA